jgi:hypothetical protein
MCIYILYTHTHLLLREPALHLLDGARHAPLSTIHVGEGSAPKERSHTELRKGYAASFDLLHSRYLHRPGLGFRFQRLGAMRL